MRKLVTFQRVKEVNPIEGADTIEAIKILGWTLVVKKEDGLKVGDWVCYFEVDSFLPLRPEFEWLRKSSFKTMADGSEGFRIRTVKLRGQPSYGLAITLAEFEKMKLATCFVTVGNKSSIYISNETNEQYPLKEGVDITSLVGVRKYEPPIPACLDGISRGNTPGFMVTDETRVQVLQPMLDKYVGRRFYVTEKLDGASFSAFIDLDGELHICSRSNDWLKESNNSQWKWAISNELENKLKSLPFRACIQGEVIGEGSQGNWYKMLGIDIRFFNVINLDTMEHLGYEKFVDTIDQLGFKTVPVLDDNFSMINDIDGLLRMAVAKSSLNQKVQREGLVFRPYDTIMDGTFDVPHARVSFKAINAEFSLAGGD